MFDSYAATTAFHSTLPQNVESIGADEVADAGPLGRAARLSHHCA
jgi:hypothetical protein